MGRGVNEALLPGGAVQVLEELMKSLDEHRDPGLAAAAGRCTDATPGRRGTDAVTDSSASACSPADSRAALIGDGVV